MPFFRDTTSERVAAVTLAALAALGLTDVIRRPDPGDTMADHGTATMVALAIAGAAMTTVVAARGQQGEFPRSRPTFYLGVAVTWLGIGVNRWSRLALGRHYQPRVVIRPDHDVVASGPYRFVRHPMYLGSFLICAGLGISAGTPTAAIAWAAPPAALLRRVVVEERALARELGESYTQFAASRPRFLPSRAKGVALVRRP